MRPGKSPRVLVVLSFLCVVWATAQSLAQEKPGKPPVWDLDEVLQQLRFHPKDPYLQYVALQLAKRDGRDEEVARLIESRMGGANGRRSDLFSTFTGALALQESLQLDTMRGGPRRPVRPALDVPVPPEPRPAPIPAPAPPGPRPAPEPNRPVQIDVLEGPTVQSHPWEKLLGDKKPTVSVLSRIVPEDFWFFEFRSPEKLDDLTAMNELLGKHIMTQALGQSRSQLAMDRIRRQLGIINLPPNALKLIPIESLALTGSDLFIGEGSDVTLLVQSKQIPALLRIVNGLFNLRARREEFKFQGVTITHVVQQDGAVDVYTAIPRDDLHVRSTSLPALKRVIECIVGRTESGKGVRRLGDSAEFRYVRTLMPIGAPEEDAFVYLSDPFIRRLVGPQVKITERRRVLVHNHLRMIGHACLMYRTEFGRAPRSLEDLAETRCAPGVFGKGGLAHPDGGTYSLSADGMSGVCSKYGTADGMNPCLEHLVSQATAEEAREYQEFVTEYNEYWRTFFDPIAVRIQTGAKQFRVETLILPLIDNSIYTTMAQVLSGQPAPLDVLPTPRHEIGGLWLHLPRKQLVDALGPETTRKPDAPAEPRRQGAKSIPAVINDLKMLGLAVHNYHDVLGQLPHAAIAGRDGKPLLSWRVALLPYLEHADLYGKFKLDEPWDSEHNKKLIPLMPQIYRGPNPKKNAEHKTCYVAPIGKDTFFPIDAKRRTIAHIVDGTSNTIMFMEGNDDSAVIWTKPDDLTIDQAKPLTGLARPGQDFVLVVMGDGAARRISTKLDNANLAALFTCSGGEVVTLDEPRRLRPQALQPKTATDAVNDLRQLGLAMHNYESTYGHLPDPAQFNQAGKPTLSWRVAILPYIEQEQLYRQFKFDEPWDSEHNKKLIAQMPRLFQGANKKLNDEFKTTFVLPTGKEAMFVNGGKTKFAQITDGLSNTAMALQVNDDSAVVWTKPDDWEFDAKTPFRGLKRGNDDTFLVLMGDGSVRRLRLTMPAANGLALFTRNGGEPFSITPADERPLPAGGPGRVPVEFRLPEEIIQELESMGIDMNMVRRFLRDGIGDQIGFHMHDGVKVLDFDLAGALRDPAEALGGGRMGAAGLVGLGLLVQFATGPSSISIPVKNGQVVDDFLAEIDRLMVKLRSEPVAGQANLGRFVEYYRTSLAKQHTMRVLAVKAFGLTWRLYFGRIGSGLYLSNRPAVMADIAEAQGAGDRPARAAELGHGMVRLRPDAWKEVLPIYNLSWAENHRSACHDNQSMLANVQRGWNDRPLIRGQPNTALMERVHRFYGVRPECPDGGAYRISPDGKNCECIIHGNERNPKQLLEPLPASATARWMKAFAGFQATLTFLPEGLRAVVLIERK